MLNIDISIEIKKKEKQTSLASNNKTEEYNKNWCITDCGYHRPNNIHIKAYWVGWRGIFV